MAKNFKISTHRNNENLHLKLMGDFDGTSAFELLNVLKREIDRTSKVFIYTSSLRNIYPFGLNVFHNNFNVLKGKCVEFVFTGENACRLAPEESMFSDVIISTIPPVGKSAKCSSTFPPRERSKRWNSS